MQAVILAGGTGTRLLPYTAILPKPLMPLGQEPVLAIVLRQLQAHGFTEIILATGYLEHLIRAYFSDGKPWGVQIRYSTEPKPLGTVGPLTLIEDLNDAVLVMNGDVLTALDYKAVMDQHTRNRDSLTVCVCKRNVKIDLGVIEAEGSKITAYTEKPTHHYLASMGVYVMNRDVIETLPVGEYCDLPTLVNRELNAARPVATFLFDGPWYDIGSPEDFREAQEVLQATPELFGLEPQA